MKARLTLWQALITGMLAIFLSLGAQASAHHSDKAKAHTQTAKTVATKTAAKHPGKHLAAARKQSQTVVKAVAHSKSGRSEARKAARELALKERSRQKFAHISRSGKTTRITRAASHAAVIAAVTEQAVSPAAGAPSEINQSSEARIPLNLESKAALVMNAENGEILYAKNTNRTMPIASITKLMTAMVVLDAKQPLDEPITISEDDVDHLRNTTSRLSVGTVLSRAELMLLALMSSENRAAAALARTYPGSTAAAVAAMNRKAKSLGMGSTVFYDPTGLNSGNSASPRDLVTMVKAATNYALIHRFTTTSEHAVAIKGRVQQFHNTNSLVKSDDWDIAVSKTGYINEAGRCLVMQARIKSQPVVIVLMDSWGKYTRIGDAQRVKKWLEAAFSANHPAKPLPPVV